MKPFLHSMRSRGAALGMALCIAVAPLGGAESGDGLRTGNDAKVDVLFAPWSRGLTPGAAVMVIRDGQVLLSRGYGYADLEGQVPITPDTAFLLGSVTKSFTAMAIMQLKERGRLDYEDPLARFLPGFPDWAAKVTLRNLLNHTAGLPEVDALLLAEGGLDADWPRSLRSPASAFEPTMADALAALSRVKELRFPPGAKWEYSNSGYILLARVVEVASGLPFRRFLEENIFHPLGMRRTRLCDQIRPCVGNAATSYRYENGSYREIDYAPQDAIYGHDRIYTTLEDMYRWDQALWNGTLVQAGTLQEAFTPGKLSDGSSTSYGFGWRTERFHGRGAVVHGGAWLGFRTAIRRIPERRLTVIVFANLARFDVVGLLDRICALYLEEGTPP